MDTPRRRRNSITRDEVIDAAFALYETGAAEVTLRQVAARIGASPMSLYAHIETKEDLLDAVADRVLAELDARPTMRTNWPTRRERLHISPATDPTPTCGAPCAHS